MNSTLEKITNKKHYDAAVKLLNGKDFIYPLDSVSDDGVTPCMYVDYDWIKDQATVDLYSTEGKNILANWVDKQVESMKDMTRKHGGLVMDLSGGMDTRALFAIAIMAGVLDKTRFITSIPGKPGSRHYNKFVEDYRIASQIADDYGFKLNDGNYHRVRITGIDNTFKTRKDFTSMRMLYPGLYGPFEEPFNRWKSEHPDADEYDIRQISWELTFNQWHDLYKINRLKLTVDVIAPYSDIECKKLKNKEYELWKYFMLKYKPELLKYPIENRGYIIPLEELPELIQEVNV